MAKKRNINIDLALEYGAEICAFKDLPLPAKCALVVYYDFFVEHLECNVCRTPVTTLVSMVEKKFERRKFGFGKMPISILKKEIMSRFSEGLTASEFGEFESFDDYHHWYRSCNHVPQYRTSIWPCILSEHNDEVFEDGWHRFHSYVRRKIRQVPVLFHP